MKIKILLGLFIALILLASSTIVLAKNGQNVSEFSAVNSMLADKGIQSKNIQLKSTDHDANFVFQFYDQYYNGIPVYGGKVGFVLKDGKVIYENDNYYTSINVDTTPLIDETTAEEIASTSVDDKTKLQTSIVIFPHDKDYFLAYEIVYPEKTIFVDAIKGSVLHERSNIIYDNIYGNVSGLIIPEKPTDTKESRQFKNEYINFTNGTVWVNATTNGTGFYNVSINGNVAANVSLEGPYVKVINAIQNATLHVINVTSPTEHSWNWQVNDTSADYEESNMFYHVNYIHDYFTKGDPFNITNMSYQMQAYVEYPVDPPNDNCNAYYTGNNIYFGNSGTCGNFATWSDIIYHEYTHGVIDHIYTLGDGCASEGGAMHEGLADYFAATNNNNSCMSEGFEGLACLRDLNNTLKYSINSTGDCHNDGRILSGALWDLRNLTNATYTDALTMRGIKAQTQYFSSFMDAIIAIDDDNGNLSDGTPNLAKICQAFSANHGILSKYCPGYSNASIYCAHSPCIANSSLIMSRDSINGTSEPNQPNTIDACPDGPGDAGGGYMHDESIENITVIANSTDFQPGQNVTVNVWGFCWKGVSGITIVDHIKFIYANNSNPASMNWRIVSRANCTNGLIPAFQNFSANFTLDNDSTTPTVNITDLSNNSYVNRTNLSLSYSALDIENHSFRAIMQLQGSLNGTCRNGNSGGIYDDADDVIFAVNGIDKCWYSLDGGSNNTLTNCTNTTFNVSSGVSHNVTVYANDSSNRINSVMRFFTVDTIQPQIQFVNTTETSGTYVNRSNILVNVTANDTNLANITIYLYNSTSLVTSTNTTTSPNSVNLTNLSDSTYYFNATVFDLAGNSNSTETRNITISILPPVVQSTSPANSAQLSAGTTSTTIYAFTDEQAICRYSTSDTTFASMTAFSSTNSTTHSFPVTGLSNGGSYDYYFRCKDLNDNTATSSYHLAFSVKTSDSGAGAGSGDEGTATNETPTPDLSSGILTFRIIVGDSNQFILNGATHAIKLNNVSADSATFGLASTFVTFVLKVGANKTFDINEDGIKDIMITLLYVDTSSLEAKISIQKIIAPAAGASGANKTAAEQTDLAGKLTGALTAIPLTKTVITILICALVAGVAITGLFVRRLRSKRQKPALNYFGKH